MSTKIFKRKEVSELSEIYTIKDKGKSMIFHIVFR